MKIKDLPIQHFSASWTPQTNHLNPATYSLAKKVSEFVKSFVFFIPNFFLEKIIRAAIYPASNYFFKKNISTPCIEEFKNKDDSLATQNVIFKTTDGAKLKGTFYQHPNHLEPNSRVVILFHGNGDFYQSGSWYNISHVRMFYNICFNN